MILGELYHRRKCGTGGHDDRSKDQDDGKQKRHRDDRGPLRAHAGRRRLRSSHDGTRRRHDPLHRLTRRSATCPPFTQGGFSLFQQTSFKVFLRNHLFHIIQVSAYNRDLNSISVAELRRNRIKRRRKPWIPFISNHRSIFLPAKFL